MKQKSEKTQLNKRILRETLFNIIFIGVLFMIIYMDKNDHAYNYETHIRQNFAEYSKVN